MKSVTNNKFSNNNLNDISNAFNGLETNTAMLNQPLQDITKTELVKELENANTNSNMVSIFYYGDFAKSRQKSGKKSLKALSYARMFIGHNYSSKVNARLEAQAKENGENVEEFKARKANGLVKISDVLYKNKYGQYRLRGYSGHQKNGNTEQVSKSEGLGFFTTENVSISREDAIAQNLFTPAYFKADTNTAGRGKLIDDVNNFQVRNYSIEKILAIAISGKVYRVV